MEPVTASIAAGAAATAGAKLIDYILGKLFGSSKSKNTPLPMMPLPGAGFSPPINIQTPPVQQAPIQQPELPPVLRGDDLRDFDEEFELLEMSGLEPYKRRALSRLMRG